MKFEPKPLPQKEFTAIYKKVPRLTIEIVIKTDKGILLTKRDSGPCADMWHMPGGTVRYGESLIEAVKRVAKGELGLDVKVGKMLGYIEYPSHVEQGIDYPVGIVFDTKIVGDYKLPANGKWYKTLPKNMHQEQIAFLLTKLR